MYIKSVLVHAFAYKNDFVMFENSAKKSWQFDNIVV